VPIRQQFILDVHSNSIASRVAVRLRRFPGTAAARTLQSAAGHTESERLQSVPVNTKRVFYVESLSHPVFIDILGERPDIRLDRLENASDDATAAPILASAHVYQAGSTQHELRASFTSMPR
jgi:hypothetical protein